MNQDARERRTAREAAVFWGIAALFVVAIGIVLVAAQPLLLAFAGVLFGTALRGLAEVVARRLKWPVKWSLLACLALLVVLVAVAALWIIPHVASQLSTLADQLTVAYETVRQSLSSTSTGRRLLGGSSSLGRQLWSFAQQAAGLLASAVGVIGGSVFVLAVALYVAVGPAPYRHGLLRLAPPNRRARASELLGALASTLRRWLLGRIVSMTAVGLVTWLGLWILGIPLPLTLGLLAGLLGFVPNLGPIASAIPAVVLAFTLGPLHVVYVIVLYLAVNLADGYGLTPLLQKKTVSVPPALLLTGQVVMGALSGVLGIMLATPLLACLLVLVRELYVRPVEEDA